MASEDQFRNYFPLMRRVILLVAVLTAVPVILWTITVFVRGYFGPPKIATAKPLAAVVSAETPAAPSQDAGTQPGSTPQQAKLVDAPPVVEARATATDARTLAPAAQAGSVWDQQRQAGSDAPPPSDAAAPAQASGDQRAAVRRAFDQRAAGQKTAPAPAAQPMPAAPAMSDNSVQSTGTLPDQDTAEAEQDQQGADGALPAATPIPGPVPLPRHRPRYFAMLQGGVPMPRPRPEAAGTASEGSATPLGWLQKIFTPQQQ
jgi:hypothetical protein